MKTQMVILNLCNPYNFSYTIVILTYCELIKYFCNFILQVASGYTNQP